MTTKEIITPRASSRPPVGNEAAGAAGNACAPAVPSDHDLWLIRQEANRAWRLEDWE